MEYAMRRLSKRSWEYHQPCTIVSNLKILKIKEAAGTMYATKYRIKHLCCGKETIMSHRIIQDRIRKSTVTCSECNRRKSPEQRRKVKKVVRPIEQPKTDHKYHGWVPPQSAIEKKR